jgi:glycerol-3-phosphate O-acyltransferase
VKGRARCDGDTNGDPNGIRGDGGGDDLNRAAEVEPLDASLAQAPEWPAAEGHRVVFLLDASTPLERRVLESWIEDRRPPQVAGAVEIVPLPPSRKPRRGALDPRLEACMATRDDPLLAPLRIAWLSADASGDRAGLIRLLLRGDPRDPGRLHQRWILHRHPDRCRVVVGEPAPLSELRRRWHETGGIDTTETTGLPDFVARQAALALERAERRIRGMRYKVPRFVYESILERPAFQGGIARLAWELGTDTANLGHEATDDLKEIAATHSPYMIDVTAQLCHLLYTRGYRERLDYDRAELERIYALAQRSPVVFLPSHKSNLDHLVLHYALYENGHPPNHTAGGINMNFFPIGPLMRRSGVFFIRRSFRDNAVYKFVLGQYIDYLIEKRFPLEWYIEGGRSRSGKLLPPRFGLMASVVDSYRRAKSEDVYLLPVSIAYDQIQDVSAYASEQRGGQKERETFGWFVRFFRALRRRYGGVYIRFGEPLSLSEALGPPEPGREPNPDEQSIDVQKLAFEVCARINRVTPITPISLVTLALLSAGDRAMSLPQTIAALTPFVDYVRKRELPVTAELDPTNHDDVRRTLDALVESGVVACFAEGYEAVYGIGPNQELTAAFYRNTIIHFFVNGAIAELSLLKASEDGVTDRIETFWDETMRLRDLLKFEFFFSEKDAFRQEIDREMTLHEAKWEKTVEKGPDAIRTLIIQFRPFTAHRVLQPFLEAYRVVADALESHDAAVALDPPKFLADSLALGKQYRLQRRIRSAESVSQVLFTNALALARNRGLVREGTRELAERRKAFAAEIREVIRRIDAIDALAASRRAGLIQ